MKLYRINEGFEGTWDEAMSQEAYEEVRELTEEEEEYLQETGMIPDSVEYEEDLTFIF